MRISLFHKIIALVMLLAMAFVAADGVCLAEELAGSQQTSSVRTGHASLMADAGGECPCRPVDDGTTADHSDSCFSCPCHAPLGARPVRLVYAPLINTFPPSELPTTIPEVYLSIFVPPQNLA